VRRCFFEALGTHLIAAEPKLLQEQKGCFPIFAARPRSPPALGPLGQKPDRMLAVIATVGTKFIQDLRLVETTTSLVTAPDLFQIFPPALQAHKSISLGNIDYESTTGLATAIHLRFGNIYPESIRPSQPGGMRTSTKAMA